mgnify:CR=1 FL=1
MKKTDELRQIVASLKAEVEKLQAEESMTSAVAKAKELREAIDELRIASAMEAADMMGSKSPAQEARATVTAAMRNTIFNKMLLDRPLNEEELTIVNAAGTPGLVEATPAKGGYLVPEEQMHRYLELRRQLISLKSDCDVIPVTSDSGKMPTGTEETGKLIAFDELNEIHQGDIDFGQMDFKIADYGDIIPVSNTLLADNTFNLMGIIGARFAKKSVNTENAKILEQMGTKSATAIKDWKDLSKAVNVTLDPAISAVSKIYTNQDGFQWLDEQEDTNNRPLLTPSLADPTKRVFRGRVVEVLSNDLLKTNTQQIPFYVGSMFDFLAFFDRQQMVVAVDASAGFTKNATYIRAIERFDIQQKDAEAMTALQFTVGE